MRDDPQTYWRDLTENYRQMSDGELLALAEKPEDLTEVARQVLRSEIALRRLDERGPQLQSPRTAVTPRRNFDTSSAQLDDSMSASFEDAASVGEDNDAQDYTWKTVLCECNELIEALQLREALTRAGIDSFIEAPRSYAIEFNGPRVLVAADQLEEARAVAAQPIPKDIVELFKTEVPEFVPPVCPQCGVGDPVLAVADPVNVWQCEACGTEWSDPEDASAG